MVIVNGLKFNIELIALLYVLISQLLNSRLSLLKISLPVSTPTRLWSRADFASLRRTAALRADCQERRAKRNTLTRVGNSDIRLVQWIETRVGKSN